MAASATASATSADASATAAQGILDEIEARKDYYGLPVGYEYFSINPNVPQGSLPLLGGEYNRSTYSDLWEWVQQQTGYLKTESEWQALSTAHNGNVPYYSDGDGSTTFRVPSLQCWVRGANGSVSTVGSYLAAGLPNITGLGWNVMGKNASDWSGAFYADGILTFGTQTGTNIGGGALHFDASRSNSIYGNSNTVQPESIVGLWLVKAYGTIVDTGTIDEQQYIDDRIAALPNTFLPRTGGTMTGSITFLPHIMDSNWGNISKGSSTLILYGKKGTIESDKRISLTSFVTRDATGTDADDGFSRYSCLETHIDPSGNVSVDLLCYKNEADTQKIASLSISSNVDGTKNAKFDGKEIDRINSSGSNYIRYENGIQICWGGYSGSTALPLTITYPAPFLTGDYPSIGIQSGEYNASAWGYNNFQLTMAPGHTKPSTVYFKYIAIGRWK
jgi:hypothetical protein